VPVARLLGSAGRPGKGIGPAGRGPGGSAERRKCLLGSGRGIKFLSFVEAGNRFLTPGGQPLRAVQEPAAPLIVRVEVERDAPPACRAFVLTEFQGGASRPDGGGAELAGRVPGCFETGQRLRVVPCLPGGQSRGEIAARRRSVFGDVPGQLQLTVRQVRVFAEGQQFPEALLRAASVTGFEPGGA